jgi:acyl carrier protein
MTCQPNLREQIITILAEQACRDRSIIKPEYDLVMDLGMDSLDIVEAAMACEEAFGVVLLDEQVTTILTVEDLFKLVESAL